MNNYDRTLFIIGSASIGYCLGSISGFLLGGLWAFLVTLILAILSV